MINNWFMQKVDLGLVQQWRSATVKNWQQVKVPPLTSCLIKLIWEEIHASVMLCALNWDCNTSEPEICYFSYSLLLCLSTAFGQNISQLWKQDQEIYSTGCCYTFSSIHRASCKLSFCISRWPEKTRQKGTGHYAGEIKALDSDNVSRNTLDMWDCFFCCWEWQKVCHIHTHTFTLFFSFFITEELLWSWFSTDSRCVFKYISAKFTSKMK